MLIGMMTFGGFACSPSAGGGSAEGAGPGEALPRPAQDLAPESDRSERTAVFAGGCFWCVEAVFERLKGVREVVSGYAGGSADTADYRTVASGSTEHAEAVRVTYDPSETSYGELLRIFFATHDPTQLNRQGPDVGPQYRSAIFYQSEEEKQVAQAYIEQLNQAGVFEDPIVTTLEPLDGFYVAESYHQDFVEQNPVHGYVRMWAVPKLEKLEKRYSEHLKDQ